MDPALTMTRNEPESEIRNKEYEVPELKQKLEDGETDGSATSESSHLETDDVCIFSGNPSEVENYDG